MSKIAVYADWEGLHGPQRLGFCTAEGLARANCLTQQRVLFCLA